MQIIQTIHIYSKSSQWQKYLPEFTLHAYLVNWKICHFWMHFYRLSRWYTTLLLSASAFCTWVILLISNINIPLNALLEHFCNPGKRQVFNRGQQRSTEIILLFMHVFTSLQTVPFGWNTEGWKLEGSISACHRLLSRQCFGIFYFDIVYLHKYEKKYYRPLY